MAANPPIRRVQIAGLARNPLTTRVYDADSGQEILVRSVTIKAADFSEERPRGMTALLEVEVASVSFAMTPNVEE